MKQMILAVDCGTTAVKVGLFDLEGNEIGLETCSSNPVYTMDNRVEIHPDILIATIYRCARSAMERSQVKPEQVMAIGITNQRASVVCVDRDEHPMGNVIIWQDLRGMSQIDALRKKIPDSRYYAITGLPNNPIFTLSKLLWLKENAPDIYNRVACFALIQDFILQRMGCQGYFCDLSNASATGLLDISDRRWSRELLDLTGIDESKLPKLVPSAYPVGYLSASAAGQMGLISGIPLISGGGDQQCAGVGAGVVREGILEITLGTAAVPLIFSAKKIIDPHQRVTCCLHAVPETWEMEGLQSCAGAALDWMNGIIASGRYTSPENLSRVAIDPPHGNLFFYPYLTGASAPHWIPEATGMLLGLTLAHQPHDLLRAVMEGIAMENREIIDVFHELHLPISEIRLTGGCTTMDVFNQMQADIYLRPVSILQNSHATVLGAAILASVGVGIYPSIQGAADHMVHIRKTFTPSPGQSEIYTDRYHRYQSIRQSIQSSPIYRIITERDPLP